MVLFFSVRGKGKSEINYKKKKNYFLFSGAFFLLFLVVRLPEKMIRKCSGLRRRSREEKKK